MNIALPSIRARHIWSRNFDVFKKFALTSILPYFAEPLLFLLALGYGLGIFVGEIEGVDYPLFLAPGILASSIMFAASYECTYSTFVRMIFQKTFDAVLCTPLSVEDIVLGEVLWGATKSLICGACIIIVIIFLGLIKVGSLIIILPVIVLAGLMFASLSMFFTAVVPNIDSFNYYFTLLVSPMFLLSGVFFPISSLPPIVEKISWFLPLTHAINIIRPAALGAYSYGFIYDILWMMIFTIIFYSMSSILLKKRLVQ